MRLKYSYIQKIQYFFACLFFFSINFEMFSPFMENFSIGKITAIIYIISLLFDLKYNQKSKQYSKENKYNSGREMKKPVLIVWFLYIIMLLSSILHLNDANTKFNTTLFLNILMFDFLLYHCRKKNNVFKDGLIYFFVSSFLVSICYYFNIGVTLDQEMRTVVFGENSNDLGIKTATAILFIINFIITKPIKNIKLILLFVFMTMPMILLLLSTASRVSIIILSIGVILTILLIPSKNWTRKLLYLLIGVFIIFGGYKMILQQDILMNRIYKSIYERNISGRDYIWQTYIYFIKKNPILGVGFSGAENFALNVFGKKQSPHNVIIEVVLYSGMVGLFFFIIFLYYIYHDAWQCYIDKKDFGPIITSISILGMVMSGQALGVKLFWTLAAYALSIRVIDNKENNYIEIKNSYEKNTIFNI